MYTTTYASDWDDARGAYTILEKAGQFVHTMVSVSGREGFEPFDVSEVARWRCIGKKFIENATGNAKDDSDLSNTVP